MILLFFLNAIGFFLSSALSGFDSVTTLNLTYGSSSFPIDTYLSTGMGYVHYIIDVFPPLGVMYEGFLWIIGWKILLITLQFFKIIR